MSDLKIYQQINVLDAARERIRYVFDTFPRICVSFSAGKDSSVMLHLAMEEAKRRNRKIGVLLIDLEAQYAATVEHGEAMFREYWPWINPYWISLPIVLRNAVSMFQPRWIAWNPDDREKWVRTPPPFAITTPEQFPFYRHAMEFEEFTEDFGKWYGGGDLCASLVGIRADESLNRFRAIFAEKNTLDGHKWTTLKDGGVVSVYPIYDWKTDDIWTFNAKTGASYNRVYDLMHKAGLSVHQMRICQPYGDDQRKGLWLFHVLEPETWVRVVARVASANSGAMYGDQTGNMLGVRHVKKPDGMSWEQFSRFLLESLPPASKEHFENKIAVFLHWYQQRGYPQGIPDEADINEEGARRVPSWRRVAKAILKNDWWMKSLSFSMHKSDGYEKYLKIMRKRRSTGW